MLEQWKKTTVYNTESHNKKKPNKSGSHINIWVTKYYRQEAQQTSRLWDWYAKEQHNSNVCGAE